MRNASALVIACLCFVGGCPPPGLAYDAGGEAGAARSLPSCVNPLAVEGLTGLVSVPIDTRGGEPGRVELPSPGDLSCTASGSPAPQFVVAYRVPGSGPQAVEVSTANPGTDPDFDSVVAVRRTCLPRTVNEPPDHCFDDEEGRAREFRGRGAFLAEGGEVLYIFVTGYGAMFGGRADEGIAQLDITAGPATAPTLEEATVLVTDDAVRVVARGGDEGRDARGVSVTFHGIAGDLLDLNSDGQYDEGDALVGEFDRPVNGVTAFVETATLDASGLAGVRLARVRVYDRSGLLSARTITVPVVFGTVVGRGEACGGSAICGPELDCDGTAICSPAANRVTACGAAVVMDLMAPSDGRSTVTTRQDVLEAGPGLFEGVCSSATGGQEDIYAVRVPAGRFDVILTTDSPGTSGATPREPDTVLYVRRDCLDASTGSEEECNDDIVVGDNQRSTVEIRDLGDTTLTAFVEIYNGAPDGEGVRYELAVTLRPVLSTGAPCDPLAMENRCELGACPVATRVCP